MLRTVFLVGTDHTYQLADENCTASDVEELQKLIRDICHCQNIRGVAEEMSVEALGFSKRTESVPFRVAKHLSISHYYCDPNSDERKRLGIRDEGLVRMALLQNGKIGQLNACIRAEHEKREAYWLQELQRIDTWPVIFICGSNHFSPFSVTLQNNGFPVHLVNADWSPNNSLKADVPDGPRL